MNESGLVTPSVENACQVPVTVPNWACWADVSAFSNTELIMVKTTEPPVAPLGVVERGRQRVGRAGRYPHDGPNIGRREGGVGLVIHVGDDRAVQVGVTFEFEQLSPCPKPPVVMRVIAVDPKVTDAQLICALVALMVLPFSSQQSAISQVG